MEVQKDYINSIHQYTDGEFDIINDMEEIIEIAKIVKAIEELIYEYDGERTISII